ncbi:hypothetical protein VTJ83DRAFT_6318 [Remersonia thermophila]|uniref:Actin-related protein 2/3 complex subunit 5 n=1 Tax=Remersonia thermophila TaxID=72144 RepID=A0ABR4D4E6_9PEZI
MSIIREHTQHTLTDVWRTINIDALQEDSSVNFDTSALRPPVPEISEADVRALTSRVRQLLRGGDAEGALRACLESPVYENGGSNTEAAKEAALQTVVEVLQSIKASDMTPVLRGIYASEGGSEALDVLMKYLYKGMAAASTVPPGGSAPRTPTRVTPQPTGFSQMGPRPGASSESTGAAMSVLLSWHEKVVEVAGLGCIGRVMTDWRRV